MSPVFWPGSHASITPSCLCKCPKCENKMSEIPDVLHVGCPVRTVVFDYGVAHVM